MIYYNPGYWNVSFAFSLKGSVFPKAFVWAGSSSALAVVLHWIIAERTHVAQIFFKGVGDVGSNVLSGFTFILGFLVVFRSQKAYSRWWEGGTLMQQLRGEWFNAASCLLAFANTEEERRPQVLKFQHQLVRLVSLLYASALQQICTMEDKCFWLIDMTGFSKDSLEFLQSEACHDHCEVVLQWIQKLVVEADKDGIIKIQPPILSRVYNQLGNGMVNVSNVRKITEYPIPFPMAQMITVMLVIQWLMLPIICATTLKSNWWAGFLTFIIIISFWSINYIATELEMPFGDDANDLPLHDMQSDLNASLITLMNEKALHTPDFAFNEKVHVSLSQVKLNPDVSGLTAIPIPALHHHHGIHWFHHDSKIKIERVKATKRPPKWNRAKKECSKKEKFSDMAPEPHDFARQQDLAKQHEPSRDQTLQRQQESLIQEPASARTHGERRSLENSVNVQQVNALQRENAHPVIVANQANVPQTDIGISPNQVGVSFLRSTVQGASGTGTASPGGNPGDQSTASGDACTRQNVYHHYHHHNHAVEMQYHSASSSSSVEPSPLTKRVHGCPKGSSDACCLQFVSLGAQQASQFTPTRAAHRSVQDSLS